MTDTKPKNHIFTRACGCRYEWDGDFILDFPCALHASAEIMLQSLVNDRRVSRNPAAKISRKLNLQPVFPLFQYDKLCPLV